MTSILGRYGGLLRRTFPPGGSLRLGRGGQVAALRSDQQRPTGSIIRTVPRNDGRLRAARR